MSATPAHDASQPDPFSQLLKASVYPTLAAGVACVVVGLFSSPQAAWSAAFGAALVLFFFSLTLLVIRRTGDRPPTTVMLIVMATYTFKVLVLGVVMFLLRDVTWVSGYAVGLAIIVTAVVWIFFEMRSYRRLRIFVYDPEGAASLEPGEPGESGAAGRRPGDDV